LIRDVADMKDIKLKFLACDSLGVRSIATFVETDKKILIDPGAALGPSRYGLPPTPQELNALDNAIDKIKWYAQRSQIITISHYHYDHYIPDECIYKNKTLLIKDPKNNINKSQTKRSAEFLSFLSNECEPKKIDIADSERFKFGKTVLEFSPPMFHGGSDRLGYVLMLAVKYKKEVFVHGSDVQGPQTDDATEWIISQRPDVMVLSGFPTIFLGWKMSKKNFEKSNQNLIRIIKETKIKTLILEHHIVRDLYYKNKIVPVLKEAEQNNVNVVTSAEFMGKKPTFLEARRKELWKEMK